MQRFKKLVPLDRRTFLRGAGVSLALPLLDGMTAQPAAAVASKAAGAAAGTPPVRLAWLFFPNGVNVKQWRPTGEGGDWSLSPTMKPLQAVKGEITAFSGLAQNNARSLGDGPGDHARSAAAFLTGVHPLKTNGAVHAGVSVDQVLAERIGHETVLPSLELGVDSGRGAGICDSGYACAYTNNISWRSPTQPSAKEVNPRLAFERLFGGRMGGGSSEGGSDEQQARLASRRSILDLVANQARGLNKRLGVEDRRKLDEYFYSVRDVERRIEQMADQAGIDPLASLGEEINPPTDQPDNVEEHLRLLADMIVLAFRTDSTRIATYMLANEGSGRKYEMIGVKDAHHQISHHDRDPIKLAQIARIDRFLMKQYAYLLEKMHQTPEGEGTLLDNSLVLYGCAIGDGDRHNHDDLPILVGGRGGGAFTPGRHVRTTGETPLCNLYLSMLDAAGLQLDRFGDSTGRLSV